MLPLCLCASVPLSVCLYVWPFVCLSVCLCVCLSVCLSVCLAGWLAGCLPGWLLGWPAGRLAGCLAGCLSLRACCIHIDRRRYTVVTIRRPSAVGMPSTICVGRAGLIGYIGFSSSGFGVLLNALKGESATGLPLCLL